MSAMKGQIGPIRMHEKTEKAIKAAAKASKPKVTAAEYMRTAAEEKLKREEQK